MSHEPDEVTVTTSRGLTYRFDLIADAVGEDVHPPEPAHQPAGADQAAHRAAAAHLEGCEAALWAEEDDGEGIESPAFAPYCGCYDCQVREVLLAAWPHLRQLALELGPEAAR